MLFFQENRRVPLKKPKQDSFLTSPPATLVLDTGGATPPPELADASPLQELNSLVIPTGVSILGTNCDNQTETLTNPSQLSVITSADVSELEQDESHMIKSWHAKGGLYQGVECEAGACVGVLFW